MGGKFALDITININSLWFDYGCSLITSTPCALIFRRKCVKVVCIPRAGVKIDLLYTSVYLYTVNKWVDITIDTDYVDPLSTKLEQVIVTSYSAITYLQYIKQPL